MIIVREHLKAIHKSRVALNYKITTGYQCTYIQKWIDLYPWNRCKLLNSVEIENNKMNQFVLVKSALKKINFKLTEKLINWDHA